MSDFITPDIKDDADLLRFAEEVRSSLYAELAAQFPGDDAPGGHWPACDPGTILTHERLLNDQYVVGRDGGYVRFNVLVREVSREILINLDPGRPALVRMASVIVLPHDDATVAMLHKVLTGSMLYSPRSGSGA